MAPEELPYIKDNGNSEDGREKPLCFEYSDDIDEDLIDKPNESESGC